MIVTISQKTNKPLCWNINLDLKYNIWSLCVQPNCYKKIFTFLKKNFNLSKKKMKEFKKDFSELRYGFSKSKINEFTRSLYVIKNQINLSAPEIKETEKTLLELEKSLSSLKKYYDYDDTEHRGIGDIENLFNTNLLNRVALNIIDKNYYKPIKTKSAFNNNYIEYESKGEKKAKICHLKNIWMSLDHI